MGCDVSSFVDEVTPQFVCASTSSTHFMDPAAPLSFPPAPPAPLAPPAPPAPLAPAPVPPASPASIAPLAHHAATAHQ